MPDGHDVLSWLHTGDLHITREAEPNYLDLRRVIDLAKGLPAGSVDFALPPGDTWPERGIFDTQLGPNRNGRRW